MIIINITTIIINNSKDNKDNENIKANTNNPQQTHTKTNKQTTNQIRNKERKKKKRSKLHLATALSNFL